MTRFYQMYSHSLVTYDKCQVGALTIDPDLVSQLILSTHMMSNISILSQILYIILINCLEDITPLPLGGCC